MLDDSGMQVAWRDTGVQAAVGGRDRRVVACRAVRDYIALLEKEAEEAA